MAQQKSKELKLDLTEIINNAKGKVQESMIETLLERLGESLRWKLSDFIDKELDDFLKEEISPEIKKHLLAYRAEILNELAKAIKNIGKELGKKVEERALAKIAKMHDYDLSEIAKRIF